MSEGTRRWLLEEVRGRKPRRERSERIQLQLIPVPFFFVAALILSLSNPFLPLMGVTLAGLFAVFARFVTSVATLLPSLGYLVEAQIKDQALLLPGTRLESLPLSEIALVWRSGLREVSVWTYSGRSLAFRLSPDIAESFLSELRAHQTRRAYRVPLESSGHRLFESAVVSAVTTTAATAALALAALTQVLPVGLIVALVIVAAGVRSARVRRSLELGADGISYFKGRRQRYLPYREIESVRVGGGDGVSVPILLRRRDGSVEALPGMRTKRHGEMLAALVREGLDMNRAGAAFGAELADLVQGQESTREWRRRVASLLRGRYRDATLSPERLSTFMRNPAADPDQRAAAAVALLEHPGAAPRIRVAAEVSADPDVRETLEQLADAEDLADEDVERLIARVRRRPRARIS